MTTLERLLLRGAPAWLAAVLVAGCPTWVGAVEGDEGGAPSSVEYAPAPAPIAPPVPKGPPSSVEGRAALRAALALARQGDEVGSRAALTRVMEERPETVEATAARVALAEAAIARRDFEAARTLVATVLPPAAAVGAGAGTTTPSGAPDPAVAVEPGPVPFVGPPLASEADTEPQVLLVRAELARGQAEEGLGAFAEAARAFGAALGHAVVPADVDAAAGGVARNSFLAGAPAEAEAVVTEHLVPKGASPSEVRQAVARVVAPALTSAHLERLYRELPVSDAWRPYVALQYAHLKCERAKPEACAEAATFASANAVEAAWRADADQLLSFVRAWRDVRPQTLGVMLPLTGKYAALGEAAKQGIALALEGYPSVTVVWKDTAGDSVRAGQVAEALILEDRVTALLGPVGQAEASAAAAVSARFGVPHVVLSSASGVGAEAPTVVRLRMSPEEQARVVARYAMAELEGRRVGILYPQNDSGETLMTAFWDEVVRLGGEVWAVQGYAPGTTEFNPVLQELLGAQKPGKGASDFAALFIPDGALTVRRLLPFLKYWGLPVRTTPRRGVHAVQLLGAAGWNHASVVDRGDNLSDNAVFVDAYYHDPDDPVVDRFAKQYYVRHQQRPLAFHAEVYDAASVLAAAVAGVAGSDHTVRLAVLDRLFHTKNFGGATGLITVLPGGAVARAGRLLTVDLDTLRLRLSEEEERAVRGQRFGSPEGER